MAERPRCTPRLGDDIALPESIVIEWQLPECPPRPRGAARRGAPLCLSSAHEWDGPHVLDRLFRDGRRESIEGGYHQPDMRLATGLADGRLRYLRATWGGGGLVGDVVTRALAAPNAPIAPTIETARFGDLDFETLVGLSADGLGLAFLVDREPSTEGGPWDLVIQHAVRGERVRFPIGASEWSSGLHFFGTAAPAHAFFDGERVAIARDDERGRVTIERHDLGRAANATLVDRQRADGELLAISSDLGTVVLARARLGPSGTADFLVWKLDGAGATPTHLPIEASRAALDRCGTEVVVQAKLAFGPPLFAHVNPLPYEVGRVPLGEERYEPLFQTPCPAAVAITDTGLVTAVCAPEDEHTPGTLWVTRLAGGEVRTFPLPPNSVRATVVPGW